MNAKFSKFNYMKKLCSSTHFYSDVISSNYILLTIQGQRALRISHAQIFMIKGIVSFERGVISNQKQTLKVRN